MATLVSGLFFAGILASVSLCALGAYSYRRWDEPGVFSFAAFTLLMGLSGLVGGIGSLYFGPQAGNGVVWGMTGLVGLLLWCLPWGLFGLQYTGRYTRLSRRTGGLLLVPYVFLALFIAVQFVTPIDVSVLEMLVGGLIGLYSFGLLAVGVGLVLKTTAEYSHLPLGVGASLTVAPVSNALILNTSNTAAVPTTIAGMYVVAFTVPALALGVALFRYQTFEATPAVGTIGERDITREIDDLVFVVDDDRRLIKLNEAALETLGVSRDENRGKPLQTVLGLELATLRDVDTVALETVDGTRQYDSQVSTVTDQHDRKLGSLVSLHDVTEHEIREQRLAVLNRVLRHNLRNKVEVVKSHAEILEETHENGHAVTISETADKIADLGHSARTIDKFVSHSARNVEVDIVAAIESALRTVGRERDSVSLSRDLPTSAIVETNSEALYGALESSLDNALTYADSTVEITLRDRPDGYEIAISDDGPGIPESELDCLNAGTETALQHGTGLGLWQLKWAVTTMGGDLEFDTSGGTTVTFTVPKQKVETTRL